MDMDYEMDDMIDALDSLESEDYDYEERRRRRRPARRPVPRPTGRKLTPPAPQQGYVTRNEFNAAMERVQRELSATSNGLKTLGGRVDSVAGEQSRQARELAARKREVETLRRDLRSTRELSAILPLLTAPSSKTLTAATGGTLVAGDRVLIDSGDSMSTLLPMLLMGGLGGDSSSQGGGLSSGGLDSSSLLVLALAMRPKS